MEKRENIVIINVHKDFEQELLIRIKKFFTRFLGNETSFNWNGNNIEFNTTDNITFTYKDKTYTPEEFHKLMYNNYVWDYFVREAKRNVTVAKLKIGDIELEFWYPRPEERGERKYFEFRVNESSARKVFDDVFALEFFLFKQKHYMISNSYISEIIKNNKNELKTIKQVRHSYILGNFYIIEADHIFNERLSTSFMIIHREKYWTYYQYMGYLEESLNKIVCLDYLTNEHKLSDTFVCPIGLDKQHIIIINDVSNIENVVTKIKETKPSIVYIDVKNPTVKVTEILDTLRKQFKNIEIKSTNILTI
jgi:hypothetical protein